ncbi:MAG: glycosyltransferase [Sphingomonas phyllosphaerae]|uniref:glycosyltransferase n=1 Tax=Sphingomonas phyllosphaerae TaxID=257003 RepID=UPI002FFD2C0B
MPGLKVVTQPYSASADDLKGDYSRSSLVLMQPRTEGFGLVGLEATCAGVPVLASGESGLAELIK